MSDKEFKDGEVVTRVAFNTIYGMQHNKGFIQLLLNEKKVTLWDIRKAKEIHYMLGSAIEACISDELIVKFFMTKLNMDQERAALILRDFRLLRQGQMGTAYPS